MKQPPCALSMYHVAKAHIDILEKGREGMWLVMTWMPGLLLIYRHKLVSMLSWLDMTIIINIINMWLKHFPILFASSWKYPASLIRIANYTFQPGVTAFELHCPIFNLECHVFQPKNSPNLTFSSVLAL